MSTAETMHAKNAISGSMAKCFANIGDKRKNFMMAIKLEATMEKTKVEVPILGRPGKGNKATGWKGTGSATFHFNSSIIRELATKYAQTGEDFYFDIQVVNEDPTAKVGKQTVLLIDCNIDKVVLAKFDADADYLEEDLDFTFEDFKLVEKFTEMQGVNL